MKSAEKRGELASKTGTLEELDGMPNWSRVLRRRGNLSGDHTGVWTLANLQVNENFRTYCSMHGEGAEFMVGDFAVHTFRPHSRKSTSGTPDSREGEAVGRRLQRLALP